MEESDLIPKESGDSQSQLMSVSSIEVYKDSSIEMGESSSTRRSNSKSCPYSENEIEMNDGSDLAREVAKLNESLSPKKKIASSSSSESEPEDSSNAIELTVTSTSFESSQHDENSTKLDENSTRKCVNENSTKRDENLTNRDENSTKKCVDILPHDESSTICDVDAAKRDADTEKCVEKSPNSHDKAAKCADSHDKASECAEKASEGDVDAIAVDTTADTFEISLDDISLDDGRNDTSIDASDNVNVDAADKRDSDVHGNDSNLFDDNVDNADRSNLVVGDKNVDSLNSTLSDDFVMAYLSDGSANEERIR